MNIKGTRLQELNQHPQLYPGRGREILSMAMYMATSARKEAIDKGLDEQQQKDAFAKERAGAFQMLADELNPPVSAKELLSWAHYDTRKSSSYPGNGSGEHKEYSGIQHKGVVLKGKIVEGKDDPFVHAVQMSYTDRLTMELQVVQPGQTIAIPTDDKKQIAEIQLAISAVTKKLGWKKIEWGSRGKRYNLLIKGSVVYIHRFE